MPLPELIEIVPLHEPVRAEITVPGSKSITNRALILAALANGETTLKAALWSEDTQVMVDSLQRLGFKVTTLHDPDEFSNRTITVQGQGGKIPDAGNGNAPLDLFVGNAGTAARFLSALVCLGNGKYRLHGTARMHERPQAALFGALRELGYQIDSSNDKLPVLIHGVGWKPGTCHVRIDESSQFASALLLGAKTGGWDVRVAGDDLEEMPYVEMTRRMIEDFPKAGGEFSIEPDASSGTYFLAAGWLTSMSQLAPAPGIVIDPEDASVGVCHWPKSGWQIDAEFPNFVPLPDRVSRAFQLGDSIMMSIVLAADGNSPGPATRPNAIEFTELGRLRVQECERVVALRTELTKCGAKVEERGDTLKVYRSNLTGAEIETYNDHRMAMCFAILGLKIRGIKLKNPACVKKTFPDFFQKLAATPPKGLGAIIRDGNTGRELCGDDLFAA